MITKEWRDTRWKFIVAMVLFLALVATNLLPRESLVSNLTGGGLRSVKPAQVAMYALDVMFSTYTAGIGILVVLAAVLGVGLISAEAGRSTIFLLLSKPVGRTRILFTKYVVGAIALFAVTSLGGIGLIISAAIRDYPLGEFSILGFALSTLLMWLGSLFVLGVALLMSVVFRGIIASIAATAVVTYVILGPESWMAEILHLRTAT